MSDEIWDSVKLHTLNMLIVVIRGNLRHPIGLPGQKKWVKWLLSLGFLRNSQDIFVAVTDALNGK